MTYEIDTLLRGCQSISLQLAYIRCLQAQGDGSAETMGASRDLASYLEGILEGVLTTALGTPVSVTLGDSEAFVRYVGDRGFPNPAAVERAVLDALDRVGLLEYLPLGADIKAKPREQTRIFKAEVKIEACEEREGRLHYALPPVDLVGARAFVGARKVPLFFAAGCPRLADVERYRKHIEAGRFWLEITLRKDSREDRGSKATRRNNVQTNN